MKPVLLSKAKNLNKSQRKQTKLKMSNLFPKPRKGKCRCGCRKKVKPPRRLWATYECNWRAYEYYSLIRGYSKAIRRFVYERDKGICKHCDLKCAPRNWEADHIIEVVNGGGGCDLSNFQTLCRKCHKKKTAKLVKRER